MKHDMLKQEANQGRLGQFGYIINVKYKKYIIVIDESGYALNYFKEDNIINSLVSSNKQITLDLNKKYLVIIDGLFYEVYIHDAQEEIICDINELKSDKFSRVVDRSELEEIYNANENNIKLKYDSNGKNITKNIPNEKEIVSLIQSKLYKDLEYISDNPDIRIDSFAYKFFKDSIERMSIKDVPSNIKFIKDNMIIVTIENGEFNPLVISCEFIDKDNYRIDYIEYTNNLKKENEKVRKISE